MRFIIEHDRWIEEKVRVMETTNLLAKTYIKNVPRGWKQYIPFLIKTPVEIRITPKLLMNHNKWWGWATAKVDKNNSIQHLIMAFNSDISRLNDEKLYYVVAHEFAHCIDFTIRDDSWHDEEWKTICDAIGAQPDTTIDTKDLRIVRHIYPEHHRTMKKALAGIKE